MRIILQSLLVIVLFSVLFVAAAWLESRTMRIFSGKALVVDGDSLVIDGARVRLAGIDAPELGQTCPGENGVWRCGRHSRDALARLIDKRSVRCRTERVDRYGRWLGRCHVGSTDINRTMILDGWAVSYGGFGSEEAKARRARRNLWAGQFERPSEWRRRHGDVADTGSAVGAMLAKLRRTVKYLQSHWFGG